MTRPRVVIVEPYRALREVEIEILIRGRFYPVGAATVTQALGALEPERPRAVFVPYTLPDGTGIDLVLELHKRSIFVPMIGTGKRNHYRELFEAAGVARYLAKPFTASELLQAVSAATMS